MNIDRHVDQGGLAKAWKRIRYCLDQLEKHEFNQEFDWSTELVKNLTIEELIGALVSAEQNLEEVQL